jgi:DNA-binding NarL/FixJ family response regulator
VWLPNWLKKRKETPPICEERLRILALSVSLDDRFLLERLRKQHDWEVLFTHSPRHAFSLVSQSHFEVILCDRNQYGYPWREVIDRLAEISPRSFILLVSPVSDDYLWREVLQRGGYDVLGCPLREKAVLQLIDAAVFSLKK